MERKFFIVIATIVVSVIGLLILISSPNVIENLEKKIAEMKAEAEAATLKITSIEAKLNNCPGDLEAQKVENLRLTGELESAADNLKKLEDSTKSLMVPARKIINLCDAVNSMCMIDKAKLLEHINSLRVLVSSTAGLFENKSRGGSVGAPGE